MSASTSSVQQPWLHEPTKRSNNPWRKGRKEGRKGGRKEGRKEGRKGRHGDGWHRPRSDGLQPNSDGLHPTMRRGQCKSINASFTGLVHWWRCLIRSCQFVHGFSVALWMKGSTSPTWLNSSKIGHWQDLVTSAGEEPQAKFHALTAEGTGRTIYNLSTCSYIQRY